MPPDPGKGKTRDKVAKAVGMSGRNYEKAKAVVESAAEDPERYGPLVEQMDKTGKVDPAYREVKRRKGEKAKQQTAKASPAAGKVATLTITKPTTTADKKALATTLLKFLGRPLFAEIARNVLPAPVRPTSMASSPANQAPPQESKAASRRQRAPKPFEGLFN